jgi:hypothetical protein
MKRSILSVAACAGMLGLAACGGGDDEVEDAGFETTDPYATDPAATTAPPVGMDTAGMGMDTNMRDTMME